MTHCFLWFFQKMYMFWFFLLLFATVRGENYKPQKFCDIHIQSFRMSDCVSVLLPQQGVNSKLYVTLPMFLLSWQQQILTTREKISKGSEVQVLKARCRTVGICCCHSHNKLGDTALLAVASPFPARISQRNQIQDDTLQAVQVYTAPVLYSNLSNYKCSRERETLDNTLELAAVRW